MKMSERNTACDRSNDRSQHESIRSLLHELDTEVLFLISLSSTIYFRVLLAVIAANLFVGIPLWLLLVGPPSSGKSELIGLFRLLVFCFEQSTLTEASLLSGTPRKEVAEDATGGVLRQIGDFGVILCSDFTSVISMPMEALRRLLAILREAYDGKVSRALGVDGGKTLRWRGRLGFVGGVTEVIYKHRKTIEPMGERFLTLQMNTSQELSKKQARKALRRDSINTDQQRERIMGKIAQLFVLLQEQDRIDPELDEDTMERLVALSLFVAASRSHVERDGKTREIVKTTAPEGPARLAQQFKSLFWGLVLTGNTMKEAWEIVIEVAFCSIPEVRRNALLKLHRNPDGVSSTEMKNASALGWGTVHRTLEDLELLGQVQKIGKDNQKLWSLSDSCRCDLDLITAPYQEDVFTDDSERIPMTKISMESIDPHVIPEQTRSPGEDDGAYPDFSPPDVLQSKQEDLFDCIADEANDRINYRKEV